MEPDKKNVKEAGVIISKEQAIKIAEDSARFLGTWIDVRLKNDQWHISATSKSARPPSYFVVDAYNGNILLGLDNLSDTAQKTKLEKFLSLK